MLDSFQRTIDYMRISVTDRCNLQCRYCMPEKPPAFLHHNDILSYEELLYFVNIMVKLGIENIKITGGEPFARKGLTGFLQKLKKTPGIKNVTITTNGVLLGPYIPALKAMGIDCVNISLDTLDAQTYHAITGQDYFAQVWDNILAALGSNIKIKINAVLCLPEAHAISIAALAKKYPLDIRFIEQMSIGNHQTGNVSTASLLDTFQKKWPGLAESPLKRGFGPARYYTGAGLQGSIGFIDAISHNFCDQCNRVRLTSDGQMQLCLYHNESLSIKEMIRSNKDVAFIEEAVRRAILQKPEKHFLETEPSQGKKMYQIGG